MILVLHSSESERGDGLLESEVLRRGETLGVSERSFPLRTSGLPLLEGEDLCGDKFLLGLRL